MVSALFCCRKCNFFLIYAFVPAYYNPPNLKTETKIVLYMAFYIVYIVIVYIVHIEDVLIVYCMKRNSKINFK